MGSKEKKVQARELTKNQEELLCDILRGLFSGIDQVNEYDLLEYEIVLQAASKLCRKAAEIHHGLIVPYDKMADSMLLPKGMQHLSSTQDRMQEILELVGVKVIRQDNWRRGAALPGFRKITAKDIEDRMNDLTGLTAEPSGEI